MKTTILILVKLVCASILLASTASASPDELIDQVIYEDDRVYTLRSRMGKEGDGQKSAAKNAYYDKRDGSLFRMSDGREPANISATTYNGDGEWLAYLRALPH